MEPKLRIIRKKKSEAENAHLDPLMRALKALHSAGAPESMTAEELERQRRSQEVLGKLTAPMTGMDYEEFALSGMSAAWTRLKAPHGSRHAILYCHGGGYTSGNLGYSRVLSSKLAHATGYDVLSFEYRLAPEFPYPAAVEDALRAWDYLMLQGYGARDIVLAGDSAGGNLAAAVSLMARDRGEFMPRTQMLLYPVVGNDYNPETSPFESVRTNGTDYILTAQDMADYIDMYRSSVADLTNPYFAPLTAHDLSNQPRTLVLSAEYCPLRDEDEAYARRLQLVNDNVSCYRIHDGIHGYLLNTSAVGLVATTYRIIEHFLDGTPLEPAPGTGTTANAPEGGDAWQDVLGTD